MINIIQGFLLVILEKMALIQPIVSDDGSVTTKVVIVIKFASSFQVIVITIIILIIAMQILSDDDRVTHPKGCHRHHDNQHCNHCCNDQNYL